MFNDIFQAGVEAIIDDDVTSRFSAEELTSWNLLTRTSLGHQYVRYVPSESGAGLQAFGAS